MNPLVPLARALGALSVRFLVIGVAGANYYALGGQDAFITRDHDLFLPPDADNLVRCWAGCEAAGLELWSGDDPLDTPRDRWLADRIVERRALHKEYVEVAIRFTDYPGRYLIHCHNLEHEDMSMMSAFQTV